MVHAYASNHRHSPASLAAAIALSGTLVGALFFAGPAIEAIKDGGFIMIPVRDDPPPPPIEIDPPKLQPAAERAIAIEPIVRTVEPPRGPVIELSRDPSSFPVDGVATGGDGTGTNVVTPDPPVAAPVLTRAEIDPRYAGDFQPDYPSAMIRREIEARIVVRVLIGADGRVKLVQPVGSIDPAFLEATSRQALRRWRFRAATRDGVAIEQWREMTVRFELDR